MVLNLNGKKTFDDDMKKNKDIYAYEHYTSNKSWKSNRWDIIIT